MLPPRPNCISSTSTQSKKFFEKTKQTNFIILRRIVDVHDWCGRRNEPVLNEVDSIRNLFTSEV